MAQRQATLSQSRQIARVWPACFILLISQLAAFKIFIPGTQHADTNPSSLRPKSDLYTQPSLQKIHTLESLPKTDTLDSLPKAKTDTLDSLPKAKADTLDSLSKTDTQQSASKTGTNTSMHPPLDEKQPATSSRASIGLVEGLLGRPCSSWSVFCVCTGQATSNDLPAHPFFSESDELSSAGLDLTLFEGQRKSREGNCKSNKATINCQSSIIRLFPFFSLPHSLTFFVSNSNLGARYQRAERSRRVVHGR